MEDFLSNSASFFLGDDYLAMLELAMAARTDARIERIFHALFRENRKRHDRVWIDAFVRAGYAKADVARFIDVANCMFRGAALMAAFGLAEEELSRRGERIARDCEGCIWGRREESIRVPGAAQHAQSEVTRCRTGTAIRYSMGPGSRRTERVATRVSVMARPRPGHESHYFIRPSTGSFTSFTVSMITFSGCPPTFSTLRI